LIYEFKEYPPGGAKAGVRRVLDAGTGIDTLLKDRPEFGPVATAARHGELYSLAKARLASGGYAVELGRDSEWELTVKFPDGKSETLVPGKRTVANSFGDITVTGPTRRGDVWSLLIDIKPKE
jgi:hypothetical protein